MKNALSKMAWWSMVIAAVAAVAFVRVAGAEVNGRLDRFSAQAFEQAIARLDSPVRYVCAGGQVFDLEPDDSVDFTMDRLVLDPKDAFRCVLPFVPELEQAETLMVAVSPESGYGAKMLVFDGSPERALAELGERLGESGWRREVPKGGSSHEVHMFERPGSLDWMFAAALNEASERTTTLFIAGRFGAGFMR